MAKKQNPTKDMTGPEKDRWTAEHSMDYIVTIWNGGEHIRAANLAGEAEFSPKELDDLAILCPGIKDHLPAGPDDPRAKGTVPGDPVVTEMQKFQIDESEVTDLAQKHKEAHDVDAALAKREPRPGGHPDNTGIDGPTMHPTRQPSKDDGKK